MMSVSTLKTIHYTLLVSAAMCFIGHGAFGIITKPIWCNYFAVVGIGHQLAYTIMPMLGVADILMGLSLLFYPTRAIILWLVCWGLFTAALRPLSGEPFPEFMERAGNFGAPLILLMISSGTIKIKKKLFTRIEPPTAIDIPVVSNINYSLRAITFLLLSGHGLLNLIGKQGLMSQYTSLGFDNPQFVGQFIGLVELVAAFYILMRPSTSVLLMILMWKMLSELFYPHWEVFEWVERGGSYGCILSLWFTIQFSATTLNNKIQRRIFINTNGKKRFHIR